MSIPKIETNKFDGKLDFVMWRRKMKAFLVQNKISPAICCPEEYLESWRGEILTEKLGDAHNCLTLHLTDNLIYLFPILKTILKSKDLDLQKENKSNGENLYVQGRVDRREPLSHRSKSKGRSKSREKNKVKCFYVARRTI
ncbi:hypothetical protein M9H77_35096 [Catharanthus roseus]|uniref:Uncharacterized protein n=1 Tax=Catharanthus roseus TaxID=4058 RepID=A0ACB9ZQL3_CATRO|nr:hypothetical protein M9H77_35096 [Catharanthus roseus]